MHLVAKESAPVHYKVLPQPKAASVAPMYRDVYSVLSADISSPTAKRLASALLTAELLELASQFADDNSAPESIHDLEKWMLDSGSDVAAAYENYLADRKAGAPRRFFKTRAHALYVLRGLAPTKLVDGSWLYGLMSYANNPKFSELARTYLEELGDGDPLKNHVVLYRELLAGQGIDIANDLHDDVYAQGAIQLALASSAEQFAPEVIGFNLGYEQLPFHLLITSHELNELGIDPYYFTLHITVDNADTGHARRAIQAVLDNAPKFADDGEYFRRVQAGCRLASAGIGTMDVIEGFDVEQEVIRILAKKSVAGSGAHSDYCKIGGRMVNDWLSDSERIPAFLEALQKHGWIKRNEPPSESRFWNLLQGPRAEMFGVFSPYELQIIHDWIRGDAAEDGMPYFQAPNADGTARRLPTYRAATRRKADHGDDLSEGRQQKNKMEELMDADLRYLKQKLAELDESSANDLLVEAMAPNNHWTPAGLFATREFTRRAKWCPSAI